MMKEVQRDETVGDFNGQKPGWRSRIFGLESAVLIACDATREDGRWERAEPFRFLYRSRLGSFYLQTRAREWRAVEADEVRDLFESLPLRLAETLRGEPHAWL